MLEWNFIRSTVHLKGRHKNILPERPIQSFSKYVLQLKRECDIVSFIMAAIRDCRATDMRHLSDDAYYRSSIPLYNVVLQPNPSVAPWSNW